MKTSLRLVLLLVAVFAFTTVAHADPIIYTISGIASGHLGSSFFNDALVVVRATADTAGVVFQSFDLDGDGINEATLYGNPSSLTTVSIAGLGTVNVLDAAGIFAFPPIPPELTDPGEELLEVPTVVIGILDPSPSFFEFTGLAATSSAALLDYNLATSIGPIAGAGGVGHPIGLFVHTTGGSLSFTSNFEVVGTSTFTASSAPEPTSLLLLGSGILSLVGLSRFRKRD
jgi:hypothetical protein